MTAARSESRSETTITSTSNTRIQAVLRLRDRRGRETTGLTVVDGLREIGRALDAGADIEAAYAGPSAARGQGPDVRARLAAAGVPVVEVSESVEARLAFGDRVEGIVVVMRPPSLALEDLRLPTSPLLVVLEDVEKPGNLGAVLRSVDGAGADALIAADPRTDLWNPNAIRASLGTIFSVPCAAASSRAVLEWAAERAIRLVAARVDGATPYTDADLTGPVALVFGNESDGLTAIWQDAPVEAVRLPMHGSADSLNVSVAAAVLLYEARRQRDLADRLATARRDGPAAGT